MSIKNINKLKFEISIDSISDFVSKYMSQIITIIVICLILIFGIIFSENRKNNKMENFMIDYYRAVNLNKSNKNKEAETLLKKIYETKSASENVKTVAGLRLAELLIENNKSDDAFKIYSNIFQFKKNDVFLRNLSGLSALNILINENNKEKYKDIDDLISKLSKEENPLLILILEQQGLFEIQKNNKEVGLNILKGLIEIDKIDEETYKRVRRTIKIYEKV